MRHVRVELLGLDGKWHDAGSVAEAEPAASISSAPRGRPREVYLFGWLDGEVGVWRSTGGTDVANDAVRAVHSLGFERLADLAEPFELSVWVKGRLAQVRFTLSGVTP